uniref:Putative RecA n=1 Tax=viral metagenome TaxID=1070528 RepID=A0A6M3IW63_9ZZZZ
MLIRRKKEVAPSPAEEVKEQIKVEEPQEFDFTPPKGNFKYRASTGSTLLDLSISGHRVPGGGVPSGIIMEVFGPPSVGKTSVLAELIASVQVRGGESWIADPEARMDHSYMEIYGTKIDSKNYFRPDTVPEFFDIIRKSNPKNPEITNIVAADSLAAFSTDLEMGEKGDKRGQQRAKEFSQGMRIVAREIDAKNLIIACSNQTRQGDFGDITPGGNAIPFHASLRIKMKLLGLIDKKKEFKKADDNSDSDALKGIFEKKTGIITECHIIKSSLDEPYRRAPIYIVFGYGIDDIRANLQFCKDVTGGTKYECPDGKSYVAIVDAIRYTEDNELEGHLKARTRKLWYKIQHALKTERKPKTRG